MPSKGQRKGVALAVPDIADDAAERKRALNILAQRRYSESSSVLSVLGIQSLRVLQGKENGNKLLH